MANAHGHTTRKMYVSARFRSSTRSRSARFRPPTMRIDGMRAGIGGASIRVGDSALATESPLAAEATVADSACVAGALPPRRGGARGDVRGADPLRPMGTGGALPCALFCRRMTAVLLGTPLKHSKQPERMCHERTSIAVHDHRRIIGKQHRAQAFYPASLIELRARPTAPSNTPFVIPALPRELISWWRDGHFVAIPGMQRGGCNVFEWRVFCIHVNR